VLGLGLGTKCLLTTLRARLIPGASEKNSERNFEKLMFDSF